MANADSIDFDTATEEELAALRGDNLDEATGEDAVPENTEAAADGAPAGEEEAAAVEDATETEAAAEGVGEATPDEPDGAETEAAAEDIPKQDFMIPKSRYDSVMARLKEMEKLQQEAPPAVEVAPQQQDVTDPRASRLTEIDQEIAVAVRDGDGDKTSALMTEARQIQSEMFQEQMAQAGQNSSNAAVEQVRYDTLVESVETLIPETNPDGDEYDEGLVLEVQELMRAFTATGNTPYEALRRSLNYVKPGWDSPHETQTQDQAEGKAPESETPEPKKTDVKRNIADAKATPPSMDEGANSDAAGRASSLDVMKISDEEFEKLSEKQLAELRGDIV